MSDSRVQDARQTFRHDGMAPMVAPAPDVVATYRAKIFKSGNSLALRLPAALGLEAGMEMNLMAQADGSYVLRRADAPRRTIDISGFAGKAPGIKLAPREDFEERPSMVAARKAAGLA